MNRDTQPPALCTKTHYEWVHKKDLKEWITQMAFMGRKTKFEDLTWHDEMFMSARLKN